MVVLENSLAYRFRVHEHPVRKPVNQPHTYLVNSPVGQLQVPLSSEDSHTGKPCRRATDQPAVKIVSMHNVYSLALHQSAQPDELFDRVGVVEIGERK